MPEEDDDYVHGVGILLSSQMKSSLLEWSAVSECLMTKIQAPQSDNRPSLSGYNNRSENLDGERAESVGQE
jgi:hypothetical protein